MKKTTLVLPIFLIFIMLIAFGTFWLGKSTTKRQAAEIHDCQSEGQNRVVEIKNDKFTPDHIDASVCDKLTIINRDDKLRLIAFGVHDQHIYYNGVTEKAIKTDEELPITLNQLGVYIIHDHLQEEVQAEFKVQ